MTGQDPDLDLDDIVRWRDANRAFVDAAIAEMRARLEWAIDERAQAVTDDTGPGAGTTDGRPEPGGPEAATTRSRPEPGAGPGRSATTRAAIREELADTSGPDRTDGRGAHRSGRDGPDDARCSAAPAARAAAERRRAASDAVPGGPVLDAVAAGFGLTPFERELVLLALAAEVDAAVGDACAALQGGQLRRPTFGLATRVLDGSHWSAITPGRPLRRAELVLLGPGPLPDAPLTLDERLVHHLLGFGQLDTRLLASAHHLGPGDTQTESIEAAAAEIVAARATAPGVTAMPIVRLVAPVVADARLAARRAAALAGDDLVRIRASDLPTDAADREQLARLWRRELVLGPIMLLVELDDGDTAAASRAGAFADAVAGPVVVVGSGTLGALRPELAVTLAPIGREEQRRLWRTHLGRGHASLEPLVERAVGQFTLGISDVADVAAAVGAANGNGAAVLWERCRTRTRPGLASLAEHVVTRAGWDDLVLADDDLDGLRTIVEHVRHRASVQEAWGLDHGARGVGISALFHGPSGTGKTLAAEVVANAAGLDLFRIDLSAVVSKYIGETEKNLSRIFDAAEAGGAVLLFDEADALFGKRSEVRDSHDRYANVEVSYLLQRMETYRGLAVLTTNLRQALDTAFLRRLHFVVAFPFPDEVQRAEMWRRVFPPGVATVDLDHAKLARLGLSGASIRGIALHASYAAAAAGRPVEIDHIRQAARRELAKLDQSLSRGEAMGLL